MIDIHKGVQTFFSHRKKTQQNFKIFSEVQLITYLKISAQRKVMCLPLDCAQTQGQISKLSF